MKIKTVVIDDEPRNIKLISRLIKENCPQLEIAGTANNPSEGLSLIRDIKPALLLLDIRFPGSTIFPMLEELNSNEHQVIFITAYNTYATEAFRQNAVDYILKPVSKEMLVEAVYRAEARIRANASISLTKLIEELKSGLSYSRKVALPSAEGISFINEMDIIRCEASGRYTIIYLNTAKKITVAKTLKETEVLLHSKLFFRVHNSHIINLEMIKKYHNGRMAELVDGTFVEISSSRKDELLKILTSKNGH